MSLGTEATPVEAGQDFVAAQKLNGDAAQARATTDRPQPQ